MAQQSLRDSAKAYIPKKTRNISEMEVVIIDNLMVEDREGIDETGKPYNYKITIYKDEEYRIPASVLGSIKTILEAKPTLKSVKVIKKGQGLNTEYTVIPLE